MAQNAIEVLKEQLRNRKIDYTDITQPDQQNNPDHIVLKGVQPSARARLAEHRAGAACPSTT